MDAVLVNKQLSKALTDALGDDAEPESTYTFLIYIQFGIIKAAFPSIKKAYKNAIKLSAFIESVKENTAITSETADIKLAFENNSDTLIEIIEDIWENIDNNPELNWLQGWIVFCEFLLKETIFTSVFIDLSKLAYNHVGLSRQNVTDLSRSLLRSFIKLSKSLANDKKIMRID